jgi:hypothetical protein
MDDVCGYIVSSPADMGPYDKMYLKIDNIELADVYVAKGRGYIWLNHLDGFVSNRD